MSTPIRRATFSWPAPAAAPPARPLAERLAETAEDRVASAAALVAESAEALWSWVRERPFDWGHDAAAAELEAGWAAWAAAHAWRAPCALLLDALRRTVRWARERELPGPREALLEELAQWIPAEEPQPGEVAWDGRPLGEGRRLPRRQELVPWVLPALERGERILVHGASETVAVVLEAAQDAGLAPEVLLTEGGPELGGKRLARRLAPAGLALHLAQDLFWLDRMAGVDRVWVGAEAVGAGAFVGRVGTRLLFEEARRHGVPTEVLATRDKLAPGGHLELPRWGDREPWILWSDPPAGVVLERQPYERVPLELVDAFWTETGRERACELVLRGSPPEPETPGPS